VRTISHFLLNEVPDGAELRSVVATAVRIDDRDAVSIELTEEATAGTAGVDYVDQPTFLLLPGAFETGVIEVDIRAGLRSDAPEYARAFAGVAYRVTDDSFESVYVRPMNGSSLNPPGPRGDRAFQYFAYPEWPFDRLRDERPDGGFEGAADIRPDEWLRLRVQVGADSLRVSIDGVEVLELAQTLIPARPGRVGLWVDIGTRAAFADLRITAGA
jgi:hypothetical protein